VAAEDLSDLRAVAEAAEQVRRDEALVTERVAAARARVASPPSPDSTTSSSLISGSDTRCPKYRIARQTSRGSTATVTALTAANTASRAP
jgi:hypothetical protein